MCWCSIKPKMCPPQECLHRNGWRNIALHKPHLVSPAQCTPTVVLFIRHCILQKASFSNLSELGTNWGFKSCGCDVVRHCSFAYNLICPVSRTKEGLKQLKLTVSLVCLCASHLVRTRAQAFYVVVNLHNFEHNYTVKFIKLQNQFALNSILYLYFMRNTNLH